MDVTLKKANCYWLCLWLLLVYLLATLCSRDCSSAVDGESHSPCRLQSFAAHLAGAYAVLAVIFPGEMKQKHAGNDIGSSEGPDLMTSQGF